MLVLSWMLCLLALVGIGKLFEAFGEGPEGITKVGGLLDGATAVDGIERSMCGRRRRLS